MRRLIVFPVLVIFLIIAGYSGWWYLLAARTEAGFQAWIDERRAEGMEVTYQGYTISGFPREVRLAIDQPKVRTAGPKGVTVWTTPFVAAWATPWSPLTIMVEPSGQHSLLIQQGDQRTELDVRATALLGRVMIGNDGQVQSADVSADGLVATANAEEVGRFSRFVLRLSDLGNLGTTSPKNLRMEVANLILPQLRGQPLGSRLEALALDADLTGVIAGRAPSQMVTMWRDTGGRAIINDFRATWGHLALAANGEGSVDHDLQPNLKLDTRTTGLPETVDALAAKGYLKSGAATAVKFALTVLGSRSSSGPRGSIDLPVSIRNQTVFLGSIGLAKVPDVVWY